jgi:hypothetical protein
LGESKDDVASSGSYVAKFQPCHQLVVSAVVITLKQLQKPYLVDEKDRFTTMFFGNDNDP